MTLDVKIMGVEKRLDLIRETLRRTGLPESCVVLDDRGFAGGGSAWYNAKRAWLAPVPDGITHRLVLQDDTYVCDDFLKIANECCLRFPEAAWAYNGGVWVTPDMRKGESPYLKLKGCRISAQAIILPVEHIRRMADWSDDVFGEDYKHDDGRIGWYCAYHGIPMFGTIPSLVEHLSVETCIPHHNDKRRVCKTWIGADLGEQDWANTDYSVTPLMMSNIWLPPNDPRWTKVNAMKRIAREKARGNL